MLEHFIKVCTITPKLAVSDCHYNTQQILSCIQEASDAHAAIAVFPELCITGYSCGDLFFQSNLIEQSEKSICFLLEHTSNLEMLIIVGVPISHEGHLFNTACVLFKGQLLGIVPKSYLSNHGKGTERRWFSPVHEILNPYMIYAGQNVVISSRLLFKAKHIPYLCVGIDIGEDLYSPIPPSTYHTLHGATIIVNLAASHETIGKKNALRSCIAQHAAKTMCGYLYTSSGIYESTSEFVFSGHQFIYEGNHLLAESKPFPKDNLITYSSLDLEYLYKQRMHQNYTTALLPFKDIPYTIIPFDLTIKEHVLQRSIRPHPFIPEDEQVKKERCKSIFDIQAVGLARRMQHTQSSSLILGVSGGLDSTLALLVCLKAVQFLGQSPQTIIGVTMPGFGTSGKTYENAINLLHLLGVTAKEISIVPATLQHLKDIGHDTHLQDTTYENAQSRERTQILMDLANQYNGLVVGTGDLSELALGWATYNGDHMSMYGVNASIPKTLIPSLLEYVAYYESEPLVQEVLFSILDTPISPELIPSNDEGDIAQKTEDLIGPYELHDFFIYYMVGLGYAPTKIYHLAEFAFKEKYTSETLLKWLKIFYKRFFTTQFKRSCLPDGPQIGSISLSPHGDWLMPSDVTSTLWLAEVEALE